jgi:hypothetical protein
MGADESGERSRAQGKAPTIRMENICSEVEPVRQ